MGILGVPQIMRVRPDGEDAWSLEKVEAVLKDIRDVLQNVKIKIISICRNGDIEIELTVFEYHHCPVITNTVIDRIGKLLSLDPIKPQLSGACA